VKYALLIYGEEGLWEGASETDREAMYQRHAEFGKWLAEKGWIRGGEELALSSSATCVRVEDGRTVTTDGPFVEAKEQLGGFYLVECDDLDQAIEAAGRLPGADTGTIEVRPIVDTG
jgi:hypothetical protein